MSDLSKEKPFRLDPSSNNETYKTNRYGLAHDKKKTSYSQFPINSFPVEFTLAVFNWTHFEGSLRWGDLCISRGISLRTRCNGHPGTLLNIIIEHYWTLSVQRTPWNIIELLNYRHQLRLNLEDNIFRFGRKLLFGSLGFHVIFGKKIWVRKVVWLLGYFYLQGVKVIPLRDNWRSLENCRQFWRSFHGTHKLLSESTS